jgi:hypothetical protein
VRVAVAALHRQTRQRARARDLEAFIRNILE